MHPVDQIEPWLHVRRPRLQPQQPQNLRIQALFAEFPGHSIDGVHVFHGNHARFRNVAEQRDLLFQFRGDVAIAAAKENVRLNSDAQHFLHAVLRGLGFQFARRGDERDQRDVDKERVFRAQFQAHLPDGFEEGKRLDVADRSANLHDDYIDAFGDLSDTCFDFVGDVRDDLHGFAEIIAAPLFGKNRFVDAAGRPVIVAGKIRVREAFVVSQVQIGFRAVFGHKHFAMLKRAHRTRIDVQVRIAFLKCDFETATFEETTNRGGGYSFSQ